VLAAPTAYGLPMVQVEVGHNRNLLGEVQWRNADPNGSAENFIIREVLLAYALGLL
jgi:hypothetical protein